MVRGRQRDEIDGREKTEREGCTLVARYEIASTPLTQSLHLLPVLVQLFERLNIHAGDSRCIGLITVRGITKDAHLELRARDVT